VEVYKHETQRVIRMFLDHEITFAECRSALDTALGALLATLTIYGEFGVRLEDCFYMTEDGPRFFSKQSPAIDQPFG
jgi:hypothetical protein